MSRWTEIASPVSGVGQLAGVATGATGVRVAGWVRCVLDQSNRPVRYALSR